MHVVLDTSVLVAALRSRDGASFALLQHLRDEDFTIAVSVPLVVEYESALIRNLQPALVRADIESFIDYLCLVARRQDIFYLWRPLLNDPNDDMVVEVAVASACNAIVTHNLKDFRPATKLVERVLSPGEFLQTLSRK